jgi:hypothetical protein
MRYICTFAIVIVVSSSAPARAQGTGTFPPAPPIPSGVSNRDRLRDVLKPGLEVTVIEDDGRRIDGKVAAVLSDAVRVTSHRHSQTLALDRIVRVEHPDDVQDGALSGLAFGVTMGVIGGALIGGPGHRLQGAILNTAGSAPVYAAIGMAFDALVDHRETLYERGGAGHAHVAVAPIVGHHARGAAFTWSW